MILSKTQILKELNRTIYINPFSIDRLNSNSYNLSLSERLIVYKDTKLDMKKAYTPNDMTELTIPEEGLLLSPHKLYLGSTIEKTHSSKYIPIIEGRSSIGRLGIFVHVTAGLGEAGFNGNWTLELSCVQPVLIYPHVSICQIYFNSVLGEIDLCASDKYQNSTQAQPSQIYRELIKEETHAQY